MKNFFKKRKGQGVVEYGGALVIAATIVAGVLALTNDQLAQAFTNTLNDIRDYFEGEVPT